jgi:hypothetical protein
MRYRPQRAGCCRTVARSLLHGPDVGVGCRHHHAPHAVVVWAVSRFTALTTLHGIGTPSVPDVRIQSRAFTVAYRRRTVRWPPPPTPPPLSPQTVDQVKLEYVRKLIAMLGTDGVPQEQLMDRIERLLNEDGDVSRAG